MFIVTIDCGTTNTRVYVIDERGKVYGKSSRKVGVKDTSLTGTTAKLEGGLSEAFSEAVSIAGVGANEISFIISSGMITSELGLKELPHLWAPVSFDALAGHIEQHSLNIFPSDIPVYFVRGIKNAFDPLNVNFADVGTMDFMRGEETQIAGIVELGVASPPFTLAMLSSHTKYISTDKDSQIQGSVTTISGQMFEALLSSSFIGKSIQPDSDDRPPEKLDEKIIDSAYKWVHETGLLRSMLMTRFLDVLMDTNWYERRLFVETCIATEDMKALCQFDSLGMDKNTPYVLIGKKERCRIYKNLIRRKIHISHPIHIISDENIIDSLSIHGVLLFAKKAQLI